MQAIRHYLLAVQFFTRIPVSGPLADWVGYSPAMLRASAAHFPGVGWLIGALAALCFGALSWLLGMGQPFTPLVAAVLSTIVTVMATGGFHEDGLADVADGLGGGYQRERVLEIMKDSRIGAFGAMALVLAFAAKFALLAQLGSHGLSIPLWSLFCGHVVSRFWPLLAVRTLPHVGDTATSKSKPLADQIALSALFTAAVWCVAPVVLMALALGWQSALLAILFSGVGAAWMLWRFKIRLQGFTGDCLGTIQQVAELAFYLGVATAVAAFGTAGVRPWLL
ncbi:adenosylcobinamide-GDP ribazoletransferase [Diaphorobacter ruginosibacter]|uniref:Adenosylcobinamide-GDP ribazoletransferase n=1 Tax=Diaphorobacter ruginosibacter TaxID=1715720 RepID=A0A7G9RQT6_9BURK|nr:adenosylcobinamide-GDP ribazoletransferase [Diaphorobacter ruginosibacter]QNN57961.1 adenosylcobinamide-GDP ribazoletransferase [Diaphorobacter ruginosibacter]